MVFTLDPTGSVIPSLKEKSMLRFLIILLSVVCLYGNIYAQDKPASSDTAKTVRYFHKHKISNAYDGEIVANDHLMVRSRNDKEMTFILSVISNENDECLIEGAAARIAGSNTYEYKQNQCRIIFFFDQDNVKLAVDGADGNSCYVSDLDKNHGCGGHTCILSGTYIKPKAASAQPVKK